MLLSLNVEFAKKESGVKSVVFCGGCRVHSELINSGVVLPQEEVTLAVSKSEDPSLLFPLEVEDGGDKLPEVNLPGDDDP